MPDQPFDHWQAAEQCPRTVVIAHLPGDDEQINRSTLAVANGAQLCVDAARGVTEEATTPPFVGELIPGINS